MESLSAECPFLVVPADFVDKLTYLQLENQRLTQCFESLKQVDDEEIEKLWQRITYLQELLARSNPDGTKPVGQMVASGCNQCSAVQARLAEVETTNRHLVSKLKGLEADKQALEAKLKSLTSVGEEFRSLSGEACRFGVEPTIKHRLEERELQLAKVQNECSKLARENERLRERYTLTMEKNAEEAKRVKLDKRHYEEALQLYQDKVNSLEEERYGVSEEQVRLNQGRAQGVEEMHHAVDRLGHRDKPGGVPTGVHNGHLNSQRLLHGASQKDAFMQHGQGIHSLLSVLPHPGAWVPPLAVNSSLDVFLPPPTLPGNPSLWTQGLPFGALPTGW